MIFHPGNGSTVEPYPIPFRFDSPAWLTVTVRRQDAPEGSEETPLSPGTDYLVEMAASGGSRMVTTLPLAADMEIRIRRRTPRTQHLDPAPHTLLPPGDVEQALDRLAMAIQDRSRGADAGIPTRALTFPSNEVVAGGGHTLLPPRASTPGGRDRRGTVISFLPHPLTGETVAEGAPPPGTLAYTATAPLLEELRVSTANYYDGNERSTAQMVIDEMEAGLEAKANDYRTSIRDIIVNHAEGTTFGYRVEDIPTAKKSLTIQPPTEDVSSGFGPRAQSYRSTIIGHEAFTSGDGEEGEGGDALVIGSHSNAQRASDRNLSLTTVGGGSGIFGYDNTSVGPGCVIGNPTPIDPVYLLDDHYVGFGYSAAVGPGAQSHGQKCVMAGAYTITHGKGNGAMGPRAKANGNGTLALGSHARAEVPYDEVPPGVLPTPPAAALAVGHEAETRWWETLAAGAGAKTTLSPQAVAVGVGAAAMAEGAVAIGTGATTSGKWSTVFTHGVVEDGAWAASGFGYRARASLPQAVEIISRGLAEEMHPGARAFLHPQHGLCLSYADTVLPPAATPSAYGSEAQDITGSHHGSLAAGMLSFHCDGEHLRIHVSDGTAVRTAKAVIG